MRLQRLRATAPAQGAGSLQTAQNLFHFQQPAVHMVRYVHQKLWEAQSRCGFMQRCTGEVLRSPWRMPDNVAVYMAWDIR